MEQYFEVVGTVKSYIVATGYKICPAQPSYKKQIEIDYEAVILAAASDPI